MGEVHQLDQNVPMAQLATRIPANLHRRLKLHCVGAEMSVMEFVTAAITEKMEKVTGGKTAGKKSKA